MRTGQSEEHTAYAVEQISALFVCEDGILEGRLFLVVYDLADVFALFLDASFYGRQIVCFLDAAFILLG